MAGYNLPESGLTANVSTGALTNFYKTNDIVNKFDKDDTPATGHVWIYNTTDNLYRSRALLSTDNPGVVRNTQTTSYTLILSDAGKEVEMNVAGANNLTVPPNSSVAFPFGAGGDTVIAWRQYGAGLTTIVAGAGVTIRSRGGVLNSAGQYASGTLTKRGTNEWFLDGDIA